MVKVGLTPAATVAASTAMVTASAGGAQLGTPLVGGALVVAGVVAGAVDRATVGGAARLIAHSPSARTRTIGMPSTTNRRRQ